MNVSAWRGNRRATIEDSHDWPAGLDCTDFGKRQIEFPCKCAGIQLGRRGDGYLVFLPAFDCVLGRDTVKKRDSVEAYRNRYAARGSNVRQVRRESIRNVDRRSGTVRRKPNRLPNSGNRMRKPGTRVP